MQYIGQQMQTTKAIRARLDKLTSQSVEYIMESLSNTTQPIKNIRAYLRTVILNAPGTMESYYQVQANAAVAASSHSPCPGGQSDGGCGAALRAEAEGRRMKALTLTSNTIPKITLATAARFWPAATARSPTFASAVPGASGLRTAGRATRSPQRR